MEAIRAWAASLFKSKTSPAMPSLPVDPDAPRCVSLALQGGGAHGAFTWGVLDRLLEDERLVFDGLSGSSAGAMNAVVMADGWLKGGREGARQALTAYWNEVGQLMPPGMVVPGKGGTLQLSALSKLLMRWASKFSPDEINPRALNPLRDLLLRLVDFEALRAHSPFKLFVAATQANTGKLRLFREHELTVDMLLASACLPKMQRPVEIEGEPYWDGGYSANPAVFPLCNDCGAKDVLLVLLTPLRRSDTPTTVKEIDERIADFAFNASFMREMQAIARSAQRGDPPVHAGDPRAATAQATRFHMIDAGELPSMARLETKALAHGPYLNSLHGQGRERASAWLDAHAGDIGRRSSVDLQQCFA